MSRPLRMNNAFPRWDSGGGIFSAMSNPPWGNVVTAQNLDLQYFGTHSGEKRASGIIQHFAKQNSDGESLTESQILTIAEMVLTRFHNNWSRLWEAFQADYNPIENYSMIEDESGESQRMTTNTGESNRTVTNTGKITSSNERASGLYGFNSNDAVSSDVDKADGTEDRTDNGNSVEDRTDSGTDDTSHSRTLTRSGNIGTTTTQQMLQSEIELRAWEYFDRVFADVDRLLTLQIY